LPCLTNAAALLEDMDRHGIERILLPPCPVLSSRCERQYLCGEAVLSEFFELMNQHPQRFSAFTGYNAHDIRGSLLWMQQAVEKHYVQGLCVSAAASVSLLDRRMYPAYSKCVELQVPVVIHGDHELAWADHWPILEEVSTLAGDFPDLIVVAAVGCWPPLREIRSRLESHENIYVALDANPRRDLVPEISDFLNGELGKRRCLWGSNGCRWDTAMSHLRSLQLESDARSRFERENGLAVFNFQQQQRPRLEADFTLTAE
jgi:predicted TIM-barrel fold metal-dependent hydrolase